MDRVASAALASEIVKINDGYPAKQKICPVYSFCKDFEDWLDLKCNLHEMVKVHVSRDRFIHTHFAPTCGACSVRLYFATRQRNFDKNLSLKTGV